MSCPICGKPTEKAHRPFCSRRCADIDLGRWLGEDYRLPGDPISPTDLPADPSAVRSNEPPSRKQ